MPFMLSLLFIKVKRTSKAIIKRYADIGSPWRAPFFNAKYWVANPPFIARDFWSFNYTFIHVIKLSGKRIFFKTLNKKPWSKDSKAFSRPIVIKTPGIFPLPQISMMHRFSTYAVWFEEITDGKIGLSFTAKVFDNIFVSALSSEIGLQFLINFLSRCFFSKNFITACLCDILGYLLFWLLLVN